MGRSLQRFDSLSVLSRLRVVLGLLLTSALSWIALSHLNREMTFPGLAASGAVFVGTWTIMMAGMMLPSTIPGVLLFETATRSRVPLGIHPAPVWVFIAGYLAVWSVIGLLAFAGHEALRRFGLAFVPDAWSGEKLAAALILAGLYQLSGWKTAYLNRCRSPLLILTPIWRDGVLGALRMGAAYGRYCVGCCGALMLVLFAVGTMNLVWAAALATVVFVEKVTDFGFRFGRAAGAVLIIGGAVAGMT